MVVSLATGALVCSVEDCPSSYRCVAESESEDFSDLKTVKVYLTEQNMNVDDVN